MQFSQNIDLKQSQNLMMSPQLQQAIKLLQMTNMELSEFLQEQFNNNPLLDVQQVIGDKIKNLKETEKLKFETLRNCEMSYENSFSDSTYEKYVSYSDNDYSHCSNFKNYNGSEPINEKHYNQNLGQSIDFRQHLSNQLYMTNMSQDKMLIASYLIGSLSDTGYLHETSADIATQLFDSIEKVEEVIKICQQFEPAGVFARSLAECLKLQLIDREIFNKKYQILLDNLEDLANNKFNQLISKMNIDKKSLIDMVKVIKTLHPKPGFTFLNEPILPIIPDVFINEREDGGWFVELNQATMPRAIINQTYSVYLDNNKTGELEKKTKKYLKESLNQASWLIKSLEQRSDTILRVASEILRQQDGFFAYGFSHLRPMNLKIVAEELGLHESTVSRVTSGKYLRCPRGLFEMKFFFMSAVSNSDGENNVASQSVKYEIKRIIDAETDSAVLNDDDIVDILKEKNILLARRTVAKYREAMNIPSSIKRRRYKNSFLKKIH